VRVGERAEEHALHRAEDRRRRPDAEGEGENGHDRERWCLRELAEGVADVLPQLREVFSAPHLPLPLCTDGPAGGPYVVDVPEAAERLGARRGGGHPRRGELAGEHLHMEVELRPDFLVDARPPEHRLELPPEAAGSHHRRVSAPPVSPAAGSASRRRRTRRTAPSPP
jgi:hypothetical protein